MVTISVIYKILKYIDMTLIYNFWGHSSDENLEHLHGMQGVSNSNPLVHIISFPNSHNNFTYFLCNIKLLIK